MVSYSNEVRSGGGKKYWLEILSNPASFCVFTLVTVANNPTPNLPEIMSNIHERGLTLAKKLSNSDTSNENQKGLSCAVTMGRWRQEALSVTRLNASHWFANDETIYAEQYDRGKKKKNLIYLFVSRGNCLFSYILSNTGQFSNLKMTIIKLKFRVYWLVTGKIIPYTDADTAPQSELQRWI